MFETILIAIQINKQVWGSTNESGLVKTLSFNIKDYMAGG